MRWRNALSPSWEVLLRDRKLADPGQKRDLRLLREEGSPN
jgi:hypothetical protein